MGFARGHRITVLLTVLSIAVGMGWSMLFIPLLKDLPQWWISPDVWVPLQGAHFVANGALGYVYESTPFLVMLPGLPILLAPLASVGEWLQLSESRPMVLAYPSIWPIYGPIGLGLSAVAIAGSRSVLASVRTFIRDKSSEVQLAVFLLVIVPAAVIYGHYEDVVALGLTFFAVTAMIQGRDLRAGVLVAAAILFKQWAILAIPALIAFSPPGRRLKFAAVAVLPPAVIAAFLLAVDWEHASAALLAPPSYLGLGHAAPWAYGLVGTLVSTPFRLFALLPAFLAARRIGPRASGEVLVAAIAIAFMGRQLFEPLLLAYYLAPGLAFVALHEMMSRGRCTRTLLLGLPLLLWFPVHPEPAVWWIVAAALFFPLIWPALRAVFLAELRDSRNVVASPVEST